MVLDQLLVSLIEITEVMLAACHDGDWSRLIDLEKERRAVFQQFVKSLSDAPHPWSEKNHNQLQKFYNLEQRVLLSSREERDQCQVRLRQLNHGAKACTAYQSYG